jgi:uncharacterized protein
MTSVLTLQSLPLFPLGAVLFPGGVLPLRIFEVRYLDMVRRCHEAGAPFGVVLLTQGGEVRRPGSTESFSDVGTLATITELERPRPGLMMVRATGSHRFRITASDQMRHGLWIANVERIAADREVGIPDDLKPAAHALEKLIHSLEARKAALDRLPLEAPWHLDDCAWVANRWCELLPLRMQVKQRLLELENPLLRLELVSDVLARTGITP